MDEYLKAIGGIYATIVEEDGDTTYVAEARTDTALASEAKWRVKRIQVMTDGSLKRTTVAWAGGHPGFSHRADNMAGLSYANY